MNDIRDGHYTLGKAYLNAEQYDEAIEQLEKVVSVDADFIEGYHALALAYFGQHRLQDAKDAALEALKIDATQNIASIWSLCSNRDKHKSSCILYYTCPIKRMRTYIKAVVEGMRRLKLRQNVKTHFILITDEPGNPKQPITGTIGLLRDMSVTVSVLGVTNTLQIGGVYVKMPNAHKQNSPNQ